MANHLALTQHFSPDELHERYRASTDPVERSHWQIIWLKSQGQSTPQIAAVTGYSENWIRTLIHRYNAHGAAGLQDHRHGNAGAAPLLSEQQQRELEAVLAELEATAGEIPLKEVGRRAALAAEREAISRALFQTDWNRKQAAELLNVSYKTLLSKIRECGIEPL